MNYLFFFFIVIFIEFRVSLCDSDVMKHENWKEIPSLDQCGDNLEPSGRIIGGEDSGKNQFPWMARLGYEKKNGYSFDCGGAVVNDLYVVTAAHCLDGKQESMKVIRVGANLPSLPATCTPETCTDVEDIEVDKITLHSEFNRTSLRNDIALVRLARKPTTSAVHSICLPRDQLLTQNFSKENLTVAGWGIVDSSAEVASSSLKHVQLPMRDRSLCEKEYAPITLDETQFCVGVESGKDSCGGDSGGPLMYFDKDNHQKCYLIGVVSFGKPICGESPSVYTNVPAFLEWILDNISE
nr:serine protease easter-like [Leptinotarsa decemlineata]